MAELSETINSAATPLEKEEVPGAESHLVGDDNTTATTDSESDTETGSSPNYSRRIILKSKATTIWSLLTASAINLLLPFVNGLMLGFGEIFAHELGFRWGWSGARVSNYGIVVRAEEEYGANKEYRYTYQIKDMDVRIVQKSWRRGVEDYCSNLLYVAFYKYLFVEPALDFRLGELQVWAEPTQKLQLDVRKRAE